MVQRYGRLGLNIVDMITTEDIAYLLKEIKERKLSKPQISERFEWWAQNYDSFAVLVAPEELSDKTKVTAKIVEAAKKGHEKIFVHLTGKIEALVVLQELLQNLKTGEVLNYKRIETHTKPSGFYTAFNATLEF